MGAYKRESIIVTKEDLLGECNCCEIDCHVCFPSAKDFVEIALGAIVGGIPVTKGNREYEEFEARDIEIAKASLRFALERCNKSAPIFIVK